jgi:hypothetical protein
VPLAAARRDKLGVTSHDDDPAGVWRGGAVLCVATMSLDSTADERVEGMHGPSVWLATVVRCRRGQRSLFLLGLSRQKRFCIGKSTLRTYRHGKQCNNNNKISPTSLGSYSVYNSQIKAAVFRCSGTKASTIIVL